ncbi:MAG: hypothetical protein JWL83_3135 [Actinomycetia bacterium]|nr:hypothetical protein [Actinomycetes bacterium]
MGRAGAARWGKRAVAAIAIVTAASVLPTAAHASNQGGGGFSAQIVNGTKTTNAKWPFLVGILQKTQPSTFLAQFCDGSLVTPTLVLSAAHCTFDGSGNPLNPSQVDILVGADDLSTTSVHEGTRIAVTAIIRNAAYNPNTISHDSALFRLASPASVKPVQIVPPPSDYRWGGGKTASVAGFGCDHYDTDPGGCTDYPLHLHETTLPMLSDTHCEGLGGVYSFVFNPSTMVCAGSVGTIRETSPGMSEGTAKSPCFGDSGGPLVVDGPSSVLQVGIVSWGPSACGIGPGVFTRLGGSDLRTWLRNNGVPVARSAFGAGSPVSIGGAFKPVVGDFNGDGKDDVVLYGPGSASDFLWRGGTSGFNNTGHISMGGAYTPVPGDFNGDGKSDILWYAPGTAGDILWLGTSTGFVRGFAVNVNLAAIPVVGDFNGDGTDDIFWYGPGSRSDMLTYGSPTGFSPGIAESNNGVYTPVVGDFDGNGKSDILWYGAGTRVDTLWHGTGTGSGFASAGTLTVDGYFTPVVGDFDGDGKSDVLWYSPTGADTLRRGTATGFTSAPEVVIDGAYVPVRGDFNGDGRTDIVWYAPGSAADLHWLGAHR